MAFALINATTETTDTFQTDSQVAVTVPATTIGNLIVVVVQCETVRTINSISGGASFSSLHREADTGNNGWVEIQAGIATSSVTTVTVTLSGTSSFGTNNRVTVLEFSGPADPLAESGTSTGANNTTGVTDHDAAAITPSTAEVLFIGAVYLNGSPGVWTFDADFTPAFTLGTTQTPVLYRIQSDTTAQDFTNDTTTARTSRVAFAAIQGALAGGDPFKTPLWNVVRSVPAVPQMPVANMIHVLTTPLPFIIQIGAKQVR